MPQRDRFRKIGALPCERCFSKTRKHRPSLEHGAALPENRNQAAESKDTRQTPAVRMYIGRQPLDKNTKKSRRISAGLNIFPIGEWKKQRSRRLLYQERRTGLRSIPPRQTGEMFLSNSRTTVFTSSADICRFFPIGRPRKHSLLAHTYLRIALSAQERQGIGLPGSLL